MMKVQQKGIKVHANDDEPTLNNVIEVISNQEQNEANTVIIAYREREREHVCYEINDKSRSEAHKDKIEVQKAKRNKNKC